jgi:hypothetical protein
MRKLLFVLLLLVAVVVGLGFYRGWFSSATTRDPESGRQGVQFEIDQNKVKPDIEKAKQNIEKAKQKIGGAGGQGEDKPQGQKP